MKPVRIRAVFLFGLALALTGLAVWWVRSPTQAQEWARALGWAPARPDRPGVVRASGSIEGEEVVVSPELGGRVLEVRVREGQRVEPGQVLIRLDESVLLAQLQQALAYRDVARANLEAVSAAPRQSVIRRAEAALAQAQAQYRGALATWEKTKAIRDNPQSIRARVDEAHTEVRLAEQQLAQAQAQLRAAEIVRDRYAGDGSLEGKARYEIESRRVEAAQAQVEAAQARVGAAQATYGLLLRIQQNPLTLETQVQAAESQVRLARAAVAVAEAGLALAKAGRRAEEVELAQAQLEQAEAAVALVQAQLAKQTLRAPARGTVSKLAVRVGEVAAPGSAVCTLVDLDTVELVLYVPESQVGRVQIGHQVEVEVDPFPGRAFLGRVVYISSEAEFTPRNVQTAEERAKTVFAVRVRLPNPDQSLKPGMPADAVIRTDLAPIP